jgi:L-aspartate oxidase
MSDPQIRTLPPLRPYWERDADVLVVGSGAAGMSVALTAAGHGLRVLLISKEDVGGGATPLAQGGLAAAIGPGDSAALHLRDTLDAGAGLCDPAAVATLVSEAPGEIARLAGLGARLERTALHLEGGHSRSRVVHAGGDAAGAEVHRTLRAALLASSVDVLTRTIALDVLTGEEGSVGGLLAGVVGDDGRVVPGTVWARAVVLATGGFGQAFATTTDPSGVTGDGLALAARAGALLRDVEFVQFHPTVLWQEASSGQCPLITEALRGAGAVLVDVAGDPVMAGRHPLGDLAPRDVVSAAMQQRMARGDGPADHLWLDATALGRAVLERDFPTVTAACRARGIDPVAEPIPVAPGAHYACGGIEADMDGRTSLGGLFAVGEAASTGVHGANRLASNSLTEALIAGRRLGDLLGQWLPWLAAERSLPEPVARRSVAGQASSGLQPLRPVAGEASGGRPPRPVAGEASGWRPLWPAAGQAAGLRPPPPGAGADPAARPAIAAAMSRHAGVMRDREGLERLLEMLEQIPPGSGELDVATVEATSLHTVSVLVAVAALARTESRGCHRWRDMPPTSDDGAHHTVLRVYQGRPQIAGAVPADARTIAGAVPAGSGTGR